MHNTAYNSLRLNFLSEIQAFLLNSLSNHRNEKALYKTVANNLKKKILYILLISGLVPATYLFGITLLYLYLFITDTKLALSDLLIILSFILGICGYIGLVMILKGLHKTNQIRKSIFIILGLIGFTFFVNYAGTKNFWDWILYIEEPDEWFLIMWPLIVSGIFLIMMVTDFVKERGKKTVGNNVYKK